MRRATIAVFLLSAAALRAQSSCPTTAPQGFGARLQACTADAPCFAGASALLPLTPVVPDCPAPPPGNPPPSSCTIYQIQACDRLTWDFGDGTPPMDGAMITSHTYATPGVYHLAVTIANALGTARIGIAEAVTIASNPPTYVDVSPSDVTVPETAGSIPFTLVRSGNLTTTETVHCQHSPGNQTGAIDADVVFAPGETTKSVVMKVFDDHLYTGPVTGIVFATTADGTLFHTDRAQYTLTEANPRPTATVDDVRVSEGGGTADVVVRVSAPFGVPVLFQALPSDGTATNDADYAGTPSCVLQPGDTQCVVSVPIVDDDVAEADETFTVKIETQYSPAGPLFLRDTATVTIVDDDAARIVVAEPPSLVLLAGTHGTVRVSVQPPNSMAQTVALSSTHADVASVPASLTIPAGGSATLDVHALAPGTTKISIGSSFSVDVTVAVPRRRASR
jgi:PKD repeat protein